MRVASGALKSPEADVCVLAGDLCRGPTNGVRWLAEHIAPSMPCVYVAGNYDFYNGSVREGLEEGRRAAQEFPNVHVCRTTPLRSAALSSSAPRDVAPSI
jgi:hypothetical protein